MAAAKSGWLQSRNVGRSADGPLAATLATRDFDELTMTWDADLEKKVAALTPRRSRTRCGATWMVPAMSIVKAGDFKKVADAK